MNSVIEQLKQHRTFRDFDENHELTEEELQQILDATRQAPNWMNGQFYSIIVMKDKERRKKLVELNPKNPHMLKSSIFLLFVADLHRTEEVSRHYEVDYEVTDNLDALIVATTDAALAMENTIIAAESLGYGTCPIGTIRGIGAEVIDLCQLPAHTLPLFGLVIGKPTVEMQVKPRLPEKTVVHYEHYTSLDYDEITKYDEIMNTFGEARETKAWSKKFADYFENETNPKLKQQLKEQKYLS